MANLDKAQLYRWFAEGRSDKGIAAELNKVPSTIAYHRKMWEKAGKPGLAPVPEPTADPEAQSAPAAPAGPVDHEPTEAEAASAPEPEPTPPQISQPPAPAKDKDKPGVTWAEPPKKRRSLEIGEWYEGAVAVVGDTYVLVDLVELADESGRSPRGILHRQKTAGDRNPALVYSAEELVGVRVVDKKFNPARGKLDITLTTKTEAEELGERARPTEGTTMPTPRPSLASPSVPAPQPRYQPVGPRHTSQPAPEQVAALGQPFEHPQSYRPSPNLCDSCVARQVCPIMDLLTKVLVDADLGPRYNAVHIKLHPLLMDKCGAYRAEEVS